jgi:DNA-directed RNA polymerase specialized sigma24 family protein
MPAVDHFPSTHETWIDGQLQRAAQAAGDGAHAARSALRAHLMDRYYEPLCVYVQTRALIGLGEPAEIVGDFFARDVDAVTFLGRWRASGMPLRRWVMNAMALHCRGLQRDIARAAGRRTDTTDIDDVPSASARAERAFDRAWAVSIAQRAFWIACADAESRGRPQDALAFRLHALDELSHEAIAARLGITAAQSAHAYKRVSARMREAVGDLLRQDGVPPEMLHSAVAEVLALVREANAG